jgi:SAM-dependent methyltransferase
MDQMVDYTGLGAVAWERFSGPEPGRDAPFFARILQTNPGPALDVGCGIGRLLLPYLQAGYEIEGVEPSADMRTILQRTAAALGLEPVVYDQVMQALDLPRRYRTIIVPCGSFQLVVDRGEAFETLRRFHAHLDPDGVLVLTIHNMLGILGVKVEGTGEWGLRARQSLGDGTELEKHARLEGVNLLDQTLRSTVRYRRLRGDLVIEEQYCNGDLRWYFRHELTLMLELVGFSEVRVTGTYTDTAPTDGDEVLCFVTTKRGASS